MLKRWLFWHRLAWAERVKQTAQLICSCSAVGARASRPAGFSCSKRRRVRSVRFHVVHQDGLMCPTRSSETSLQCCLIGTRDLPITFLASNLITPTTQFQYFSCDVLDLFPCSDMFLLVSYRRRVLKLAYPRPRSKNQHFSLTNFIGEWVWGNET